MSHFIFSVISPDATYQLDKSVVAVDEGSQVTITLDTTGVQNGQQLPYTITGTDITTGDFVALPSLTGNFTVQNNNAIAILTAAADTTSEGSETFTVTLDDSLVSTSVDINDTSTGGPTYPSSLWKTLLNPVQGVNDHFSSGGAIGGNYAVVGASGTDVGATNTGRAYVFDVSTGSLLWTLINPSPDSYDWFGTCVAINGNNIAIGAPAVSTGRTGKVCIFDAGTGSLVRTIAHPAATAYANFGASVAISGNYVAVGATNDSTDGDATGRAFVVDITTGNLVSTLINPTPDVYEYFGNSIAISGEYVVVGAMYDSTTGSGSGSIYVYNTTSGALIRTIANPTPADDDSFGENVSISGNYVITGASGDDTTESDSGSAYIFDVTTGALVRTLANPSPGNSDYFGTSVAISGNYAIVGAYDDDTTGSNSGSSYVFDVTTGALLSTLANPTPSADDAFSLSYVAITGNYALVGSSADDTYTSNTGCAYIFGSTP